MSIVIFILLNVEEITACYLQYFVVNIILSAWAGCVLVSLVLNCCEWGSLARVSGWLAYEAVTIGIEAMQITIPS